MKQKNIINDHNKIFIERFKKLNIIFLSDEKRKEKKNKKNI